MTFQLQTELMQHQREGLQRALECRQSFAHLAEMGCGKTLTLLAEFQARVGRSDIMDLLVIAPKGSVRNWFHDRGPGSPSEITRHLDPRLRSDLQIATNGRTAVMRRQLEHVLAEQRLPRALFVNIEALSKRDGEAEKICHKFLKAGRCMMVIDESARIKNHKAQRTKTVLRLGKLARSRRVLTGLVAPNSPLDVFAQYLFLDRSILGTSFTLFRSRYAKMSFICQAPDSIVDFSLRRTMARARVRESTVGWTRARKIERTYELGGWIPHTAPIVDGYRNIDELRKRLAPHCHRVLKKDCLDLPDKIYQLRDSELTSEQRRVYGEVLADATSRLDAMRHVTATSAMSQILRLHQVCCGHVRTDEGELVDLPSHRPAEVLEVLEEHDGKAVVWVAYVPELEKISAAIAAEYGEESVARYWGENAGTRADDETRFLTDPRCRFMVATPATGGVGNNWQAANLAIYAANDWNLEHRLQSEDRIHRKGQSLACTYVDLQAIGTVEEKIVQALRAKMDLGSAVTGEELRRWLV